MFSIVQRKKREAEKARYHEAKKKIKALREQCGVLRETVKELKNARNEATARLEWQIAATQSTASYVHRLAVAESRAAELELALVTAELRPLPRPLDFPLPPPDLRHRIGADYAGIDFLAKSSAYAGQIATLLTQSGHDCAGFRSVLDWGCGCGRIARHVRGTFPQASYHGLDIDAQAIEWCRTHLAEIGRFDRCPEIPPTPCADAGYDLILALSVFTHLRLDAEKQWLKELARLARPGALLFLTYLDDETTRGFGLGDTHVVESARGFTCYATLNETGLPYFNLTSSHTEECLRDLWGEWFQIVSIHPAGLGVQGVVMARAKS
jgi:2-polyprenyl-3-methyl-5-hydroxy-6-metoxy-1,4-benzoquinol methylase